MENVAIHESKASEKVIRFIGLDKFNDEFQKEYNNGNVYGVYQEGDGLIAQLAWPEGYLKDILR